VMSVTGHLDFGLSGCRKALPDLWVLADRLPEALDELVACIPAQAVGEAFSARA